MVWTCRAQHRLDYRSTQAECGCTEKIWQAKEIMGWSAREWQKEATYGFCWPSESFWVERKPSRKTCQKAQPSVEENRALKWIWWWWWCWHIFNLRSKFGPHCLIIWKYDSHPSNSLGNIGKITRPWNICHSDLYLLLGQMSGHIDS